MAVIIEAIKQVESPNEWFLSINLNDLEDKDFFTIDGSEIG